MTGYQQCDRISALLLAAAELALCWYLMQEMVLTVPPVGVDKDNCPPFVYQRKLFPDNSSKGKTVLSLDIILLFYDNPYSTG